MAECVLSLIVAETVQRSTNQDKQGYETGYRFVEQMSERRLGTDPLEVMKFLCKELWFGMFGKQVDKLQTNHDNKLLQIHALTWLESALYNFPSLDPSNNQLPQSILRGLEISET